MTFGLERFYFCKSKINNIVILFFSCLYTPVLEFTSGYKYQSLFSFFQFELTEQSILFTLRSFLISLNCEKRKKSSKCVSVWVVSLILCTVKKNQTYISVVSTFRSNIRFSVCRWYCYISYNVISFITYIVTLCFFMPVISM